MTSTTWKQIHEAREAWHEHTESAREQALEARRQLELSETWNRRRLELQENEPELEMEDGREVDVDEPEQQPRTLSGEELAEAVRTAGRATEILAAREQTQQMEETERARREEPTVVEPSQIEAPEMELAQTEGYEVEM